MIWVPPPASVGGLRQRPQKNQQENTNSPPTAVFFKELFWGFFPFRGSWSVCATASVGQADESSLKILSRVSLVGAASRGGALLTVRLSLPRVCSTLPSQSFDAVSYQRGLVRDLTVPVSASAGQDEHEQQDEEGQRADCHQGVRYHPHKRLLQWAARAVGRHVRCREGSLDLWQSHPIAHCSDVWERSYNMISLNQKSSIKLAFNTNLTSAK